MRNTFLTGVLALALAGGALAAPARAADSYDLDVVLPLTGNASFLGKGEQESLRLLEKAVNADGGIHGRPLRFVFADDQSSPQVAVQLVSQILAHKPKVVLGSALVAMCNAMAPLMANGPVMYCFSPGIHPKPGSYVFTSNVSTVDIGSALIRYFRLKGWTRIALITSTDASGQDAERGLKEVLAQPENKDSVTLVENAHFNPADLSVSAQIERVKALNPQALIAWSSGSPVGTVFKAITQAGLDIPIGTTNANMTYAQMTQYAAFLPKELYIPGAEWPEHQAGQVIDPGVAQAHRRMHGTYHAGGLTPDNAASLSWDPALIVVDALKALPEDVTPEQLRDHLAHLRGYAGVNGVYDFAKVPQRGLDEQQSIVTRWVPSANAWQIVSKPAGVPLDQ